MNEHARYASPEELNIKDVERIRASYGYDLAIVVGFFDGHFVVGCACKDDSLLPIQAHLLQSQLTGLIRSGILVTPIGKTK